MPPAPHIDEVISWAYDFVLDANEWDNLLAACAQLVGGNSLAIYVKPRVGTSSGRMLTSAGFDPNYDLDSYLGYFEARSPLVPRYREMPEGRVRALGQYAFSAAYRETEYFQDWVRPQGFGDLIGSHLVRTPQLYAWMSIRRDDARGVYSGREIRAAGRVAHHLGRVLKLRCRFESERGAVISMRESLDLVSFAILIVDMEGKVLTANRAAEAMMRQANGLKCYRGRLACERSRETSVLHDAIRAAAQPLRTSGQIADDFCIIRSIGQRPLAVHVAPMAAGSAWSSFAPVSGAAVVFVIDPEVHFEGFTGVASAYGLTPAERRVLQEIVRCVGLGETAEKLRIALPTARTHLQHIFEKTDTRSQAELVRLVMMSSLQLRNAGH